jgi:hypothetical protein
VLRNTAALSSTTLPLRDATCNLRNALTSLPSASMPMFHAVVQCARQQPLGLGALSHVRDCSRWWMLARLRAPLYRPKTTHGHPGSCLQTLWQFEAEGDTHSQRCHVRVQLFRAPRHRIADACRGRYMYALWRCCAADSVIWNSGTLVSISNRPEKCSRYTGRDGSSFSELLKRTIPVPCPRRAFRAFSVRN